MRLDQAFSISTQTRRRFFQTAGVLTAAPSLAPGLQAATAQDNVFGPRPDFAPQIGTLVSEMNWMREAVLRPVKGMTKEQLDFLLDGKANRIGALLLHLAATEKLYQLNTFDGIGAKALFQSAAFKEWAVPMNLGEPARESIKGHDLNFYLDKLREGREKTLSEFRKRDDAWLLSTDPTWPWGPTNNLCKWFHVCEHESHHTGQISLIKSRVPGMKSDNG